MVPTLIRLEFVAVIEAAKSLAPSMARIGWRVGVNCIDVEGLAECPPQQQPQVPRRYALGYPADQRRLAVLPQHPKVAARSP